MDRWGPTCSWPGLIPLERELRERLHWFVRLRWLAALGIFAWAWGSTTFIAEELSPLPLCGVGVAVVLYNAVFLALSQRVAVHDPASRMYRGLVYIQIGLDWLALVFLIHYAGGVQSPVPLAFTFHVIIAAILLSRWACYLHAGMAVLLIGALILLEQSGWWPPVVAGEPVSGYPCDPARCLYRWLTLSIFLGGTAFLTSSITVPLRRKEEWLFSSEQALERAYSEMETLHELGQVVNATLDLDQILGTIARNGAQLMGVKACSIRLLEQDGEHLRIGAAYGLSETYLEKGRVRVARSGIDAEALSGRTVQVRDATADSRFQYSAEARREGIRAVLCAPLQAKGKAIGCIRVYADQVREFSREEESFLLNLANLGAVAIENARAYADVQALSEERAWFARVTHHQLRAPLAAVKSMLDALRYAGELTPKQAELVERGRKRVDELLDMIRDLLDLAAAQRPLAGRQAQPVKLAECLAEAVSSASDRAAHKDVDLQVELPEDARVLADPDDVERIFANLLDNGIKYTPGGGRIELRAERQQDEVVILVEDSGIGIKVEDQERIFQGFYRTEAAKSSGEMGTGMGLSIVARLVERWGGSLSLDSALQQGSRFTVRLPAAT